MLKIQHGLDDSHLVFYNCEFRGLVLQNNHGRKILYQAVSQDGLLLGESVVYGEALQLILGTLFDHIRKNSVDKFRYTE